MTNRKCYQCGDDDLAAIQAARNAEIRAHAANLIVDSDRLFAREQRTALPPVFKTPVDAVDEISDWEGLDQPIEEQQETLEILDKYTGDDDVIVVAPKSEQPPVVHKANKAKK